MDFPKTRTHTPLKNHLVRIRTSQAPVPVGGHSAHYQQLHDANLHEVDGVPTFEHPLALLMTHVNRYKDDLAAMTVLLDLAIANNGMHHDLKAIKAGKTDPARVFEIAWVQDKNNPDDQGREAEGFITTAEGKVILPVDLHDANVLYGIHHAEASREAPHPLIPSRGGQLSRSAIAALDAYLAEVGVQPNHPVIRREFCHNCQGRASHAEVQGQG